MSTLAGAICSKGRTPILAMQIRTPLGPYSVKVCGDGVHSVDRVNANAGPFPTPDLSVNVLESNPVNEDAQINGRNAVVMLKNLVEWFHLFFTDLPQQEKNFPKSLKICTPGATELQVKIWEALQTNVGIGQTISYGELAKLVDRPNAARAVGSAMRRNPNPLIVPCHRVVKANEEIGNYSGGGRDVKIWLLEHEKNGMKRIGDRKVVASP